MDVDKGGNTVKKLTLGLSVLLLLCVAAPAFSQDPISRLRDETVSYFKPLKGRVLSVSGQTVSADISAQSGIRAGMRFAVLREGAQFLHPVTKEPLGRVEVPVGLTAVREVSNSGSVLAVLSGEIREGDIVRISEMKTRVLFYQDRKVEWGIGEHYYRLLKESGRIDLVDTSLDNADDAAIVQEAKARGAALALVLRARESGADTILDQRLIWIDDGSRLSDLDVKVDSALAKELSYGDSMFLPATAAGDVLYFFDLPFSGRLVTSGDIDGNGQQELIIASGRNIGVYVPGVTLQNTAEISGKAADDYLWIDTFDVNSDGRDEIIVTLMRDEEVVSSIYTLRGPEFVRIWEGRLFLRRLHNGLVAQNYERGEGYQGPVVKAVFENNALRKGEAVKLPRGVNIYDFAPIDGLDGLKYVVAYDDAGYLNLYNSEGLRVWRSKEDTGGFETVFRKTTPTIMVDRGVWSVKDRLLSRNREAFVVKRIPLTAMAKGLGYRSSQVRALFWTGVAMEERVLIDGISGSVLDYAVIGDRLVVISKPLFGIKAKNILKGESPLGSLLYVYSLKGK